VKSRLLDQARKGIKKLIDVNKSIIIIYRKALVDDGFGGLIPDPFGEPIPHSVRCRISHDQVHAPTMQSAPSGFSSDIVRYILIEHNQDIVVDDVFNYNGREYKIGLVDPLEAFGGIIGYQAPLQEAVTVQEAGT
jgi:hypothetical protein